MKETNIFNKLYKLICKDTGGRNESAKLIIVTRLLMLTMVAYSFFNIVLFQPVASTKGRIFFYVSMIVFLGIFVWSYYQRTFVSYCMLNLCMLVWVVVNVRIFGWNIGVQTFIFVLLFFCFFAKYRQEHIKIAYVLALLALRLYLFFYCQNNNPGISIPEDVINRFQLLNSFAIFWSMSMLAYFFSTDTQALEGKLIEYNQQLKMQASIDPLTSLHNRRSTLEYLEGLLASAEHSVSICLCDIDFFKRINDTYGHNVGDIVLQKLASTFTEALPSGSFISRWGGEEFLLIFPDTNGDEAKISLETLRQKIKEIVFDGGSETFSISLTYGLVEYDFQSNLTAILKEADDKLYLGKEGGRDRIVF